MWKKVEKLDIKILQLGKWQVPKTKTLDTGNENNYLSMGYFDMINVIDVQENPQVHAFRRAYNGSPRQLWKPMQKESGKSVEKLEEYTVQELMLFTNVSKEEFSDEYIKKFWQDDSLLLFVSLIHIDNDSQIDSIIKKLKEEYLDEKSIYYFSFDYSGIVLLSKAESISQYIKKMFQLNYQENEDGEKLIRDSYSFYGFNKKKLQEIFQIFSNAEKQQMTYKDINIGYAATEKFSATINIGIQNFKKYEQLREKLSTTVGEENYQEYGLLGRHDISIVNETADLKWLIYVQYILNDLTKEENSSFSALFSTHETFVKIKLTEDYVDGKPKGKNETYHCANVRMHEVCNKYFEAFDKCGKKYDGQYEFPIYAVQHSILSILKNRYAEDFVLCMYQPFIEFVEYLTGKLEDEDNAVRAFDKCYSDFFACINSLVNSAMHSERQFIQATAFNAVIYDVPAKIMAFYMAVIQKTKRIMGNEEDRKYTFILTPSFSNEIAVEIISYREEKKLPADRILKVSINEKSLYDPPAFEQRMTHEIAHFLGDKLRNRRERKVCIEKSILYIVIFQVLPDSLLNLGEFQQLVEDIYNVLIRYERFDPEKDEYSVKLYSLGAEIAKEFLYNSEIECLLYDFVKETLKKSEKKNTAKENLDAINKYLSEICTRNFESFSSENSYVNMRGQMKENGLDVLANLVMDDVKKGMLYLDIEEYGMMRYGKINRSIAAKYGDKPLKKFTLGQYVKDIISMYSESFSDIQMILVTGIGYCEYLKGFIYTEEIDLGTFIKEFCSIGRVFVTVMTLSQCGVWGEIKNFRFCKGTDERIIQLHSEIVHRINALDYAISEEDKNTFENVKISQDSILNKSQIDKKMMIENDFLEEEWEPGTYENDSLIQAIIHAELYHYLMNCMKDSIAYYESEERSSEIANLRKDMQTVNECKDIKMVFETITSVIQNYNTEIFHLTSQNTQENLAATEEG